MLAAAEAGADIIEIGVPWSDPSADGKAIQAAMHRALASGGGMTKALALCRTLRQAHPNLGIVLFGYANPIVVMGPEAFAKAAHDAGADGVLCVDYPRRRGRRADVRAGRAGARLHSAAGADVDAGAHRRRGEGRASGFIYYVSLTGITGTHLADMEEPRAKVAAIRGAHGRQAAGRRRLRHPDAGRRARRRQLRRRRRRRQRRRRGRREGGRRRARSGARSGAFVRSLRDALEGG